MAYKKNRRRYSITTDSDTSRSIYCNTNNYGFKLNINHDSIKPYYERYKRWKGIAYNHPLTDEQRIEFESYMFSKIIKEKQS